MEINQIVEFIGEKLGMRSNYMILMHLLYPHFDAEEDLKKSNKKEAGFEVAINHSINN